jgi:hypothetical protein
MINESLKKEHALDTEKSREKFDDPEREQDHDHEPEPTTPNLTNEKIENVFKHDTEDPIKENHKTEEDEKLVTASPFKLSPNMEIFTTERNNDNDNEDYNINTNGNDAGKNIMNKQHETEESFQYENNNNKHEDLFSARGRDDGNYITNNHNYKTNDDERISPKSMDQHFKGKNYI